MTRSLLLFILFILPQFVLSQISGTLNLNSILHQNDYSARDQINLNPGTIAHTNSSSFILHFFIDKSIQADATYQSVVNLSSATIPPIDFTLPVGSLKGAQSVNLTGQATYDIPIYIPGGTNNLVPTLGVSYNSGSAEGIIGRGWNIRGISFITRSTKDLFHDCEKKAIQLTVDDVYTLDGVRIIGNKLESDNISEVTHTGDEFIVKTKDGLILNYGNTTDSKLEVTNPVTSTNVTLNWYLKRITDQHTNYINYDYYNSNGEVLLKEITYTGNSATGLTPYNSIKFFYDVRNDKVTKYINNNAILSSRILREIEISSENNFTKSYKFLYGYDSETYLNEIVEVGSDLRQYNSTYIGYGDKNPGTVEAAQTISNTNLGTHSDYRTGDFNGDGRADVLEFEYNGNIFNDGHRDYNGTWKLYINSSSTPGKFIASTPTASLPTGFSPYSYMDWSTDAVPVQVGMQSADFNFDGKDDILIASSHLGATSFRVYYSTGNDFTAGTHPFFLSNMQNQFVLADVDGDGVMEGVEYTSGLSNAPFFKIFWFADGHYELIPSTSIKDMTGSNVTTGHIYRGFNAIDFDGDGTNELMTTFNQKFTVLKLKIGGSPDSREIYQELGILSSSGPQNYFGDFNGDGITDNVKIPRRSTSTWPASIRLGTGSGYTSLVDIAGTTNNTNTLKYIIADINNNGKSDLIRLQKVSTQIKVWANFDNNYTETSKLLETFSNVNFPDVVDVDDNDPAFNSFFPNHNPDPNSDPEFITADFNGDARADIFFKTTNSGNRSIMYLNPESSSHLVNSITNGFRTRINFEYKSLANGGTNLYVKGNTSLYPAVDIQPALYVVSEMSVSDGLGGFNTNNYKYIGASTHLNGKGFLGFDETITTNNTTLLQEQNEYELNTVYYEKVPKRKSVFLLPDLVNPINTEEYTISYFQTSTPLSCAYYDNFTHVITFVSKPPPHFAKVDQAIYNDIISGKNVTKDYIYDQYNNVTQSIVNTNGGLLIEDISTIYDHAGTFGSVLNVPVSITQTITRASQIPNTRVVTHAYDPLLGSLLHSINDPTTTNQVNLDYTYYSTGVMHTKQTSSVGLPTKLYTFEYDPNFRYVIKETNPLNQFVETTYDPRWNVPITQKNIAGLTSINTVDNFGRIIQTESPDHLFKNTKLEWIYPFDIHIDDPLGVKQYCLYTEQNRITGQPTSKVYFDHLGRGLITEQEGFNAKLHFEKEYDKKGNTYREAGPYKNGTANPLIRTNFFRDDRFPNELDKLQVTDVVATTNTTDFTYTFTGGNKTIDVSTPRGNSSKTTDPTGKLMFASDAGGPMEYEYNSQGLPIWIKINGAVTNTFDYDDYGNQKLLFDKDAQVTQYDYNAYGQLKYQIDQKGNISDLFVYDELDRLRSYKITGSGENYIYNINYNTSGNGINKISDAQVVSPTGTYYTNYSYDQFDRLLTYNEITGSENLTTTLEYNSNGEVSKTIYPNGFTTTNEYDSRGFLNQIKNNGTSIIWESNEVNIFQKCSKFTLGNSIQTQVTDNNFGFTTQIDAGTIQSDRYDFDPQKANMSFRQDLTRVPVLVENFLPYDPLNRLTNVSGPSPIATTYDPIDGTIASKTDAGSYSAYNNVHPDAVEEMTLISASAISHDLQKIDYNGLNKVKSIDQNLKVLDFIYGPEHERRKTEMFDNAVLKKTKYFHPNFEKIIHNGHTYDVSYVFAPSGLCAMDVSDNGTHTLYYVYTDVLGSIIKLTDANGLTIAEQNFDAWGRKRNPADWTYTGIPAVPVWLDRGYTGHEMLEEFDLINMNGRLYDPKAGSMLSPDNFINDGSKTISFNRYNYALNNPLLFSDPSGNSFNPMVLALPLFIVGSVMDHLLNADDYEEDNFWDRIGAGFKEATHAYSEINSIIEINLYHDENISISISPSFTSLGANLNLSYTSGDVTISASIGGSYIANPETKIYGIETRTGIGAGYYNRNSNIGFSFGVMKFGGVNPQNNWILGVKSGDFSFTTSNDAWFGGDKWRTGALEIGIGDFSVGFNVYTTTPSEGDHDGGKPNEWKSPIHGQNAKGLGTYTVGRRLSSNFYIGYRYGNTVYRLGDNAPWVQDLFQNGLHKYGNKIGFLSSSYFKTDYDTPAELYYFQGTYNPLTLY